MEPANAEPGKEQHDFRNILANYFGPQLPQERTLVYLESLLKNEATMAEGSYGRGSRLFLDELQSIFHGHTLTQSQSESMMSDLQDCLMSDKIRESALLSRMTSVSPVQSPETPPQGQPSRLQDEKSMSPLMGSPMLTSRSPPAAAFLASSMSSSQLLSSLPSKERLQDEGGRSIHPADGFFLTQDSAVGSRLLSSLSSRSEPQACTERSEKKVKLLDSNVPSDTSPSGTDDIQHEKGAGSSLYDRQLTTDDPSTENADGQSSVNCRPKGSLARSSSGLDSFSASKKVGLTKPSFGSSLSFGRLSLNPNAAEFVPTKEGSASPERNSQTNPSQQTVSDKASTDTLAGIDRSISCNSSASDDEYRRYWRDQLPDEIIGFDDPVRPEAYAADSLNLDSSGIDMPPSSLTNTSQEANMAAQARGLSSHHPDFASDGFSNRAMAPAMGPNAKGQHSLAVAMHPSLPSQQPGSSFQPPPSQPWGPQASGTNPNLGPPHILPSSGMPGNTMHLSPNDLHGPPVYTASNSVSQGHFAAHLPGPMSSPHMSPSRGPLHAYSSPQSMGPSRFSGYPPNFRGGASPTRMHSYPRPYPSLEPRASIPPPFELPPGPAAMHDRLPPPPMGWNASGMDGVPFMDMPPDASVLPPGHRLPPPGHPAFMEDGRMDDSLPIQILSNEFPNYASESLADIFFANGADLERTMEMLTQLELQENNARASSLRPSRHMPPDQPPSLSAMDFPSLQRMEMMNGMRPPHPSALESAVMGQHMHMEEAEHFARPRGPMAPHAAVSRGGPDFASVVRKPGGPPQGMGGPPWQFEGGRGVVDGPMRRPHPTPGGGFDPRGPVMPHDRMESFQRGGEREAYGGGQPWLETGDAVANLYAEMREEARDHARVRNICFEQATQAYLAGNKALAKELSAKGQWHNEQMKAAHAKASESIFRQRNMASGYVGGGGGPHGQSRVLDLHGLHVNEALLILKRELAALRNAARKTQRSQEIYVCVGTGHHTKGRSSSRLPAAVERYLVEDEHTNFTETQPGMLRIVV